MRSTNGVSGRIGIDFIFFSLLLSQLTARSQLTRDSRLASGVANFSFFRLALISSLSVALISLISNISKTGATSVMLKIDHDMPLCVNNGTLLGSGSYSKNTLFFEIYASYCGKQLFEFKSYF